MSRVGNKPIEIPENIEFEILDNKIKIKGPYGCLYKEFLSIIHFEIKQNNLFITRLVETKKAKAYHGLIRVLIQNIILGVTKNYVKILHLEGIGFKFSKELNLLTINVGYTHPFKFLIPDTLNVQINSTTKIQIAGPNKEEVTLFADSIRRIKFPEPYKGKGILYEGEQIIKKIGKTRR